MQLNLFTPERLAHKPYCTDALEGGIQPRASGAALRKRYIQANCPALVFRLVLDVDHNIRATAELHSWAADFCAPMPNWTALSPSGRGHVGYEIGVPIARHVNARAAPERLAAAVEDALGRQLQADQSYAGLLCKNPLHPAWQTVLGRPTPYDLGELAEWVDLKPYGGKKPRCPAGALGRNVALFDRVRHWSYSNVRQYRAGRFEQWSDAVLNHALSVNHFGDLDLAKRDPLAYSEVLATAKSVAKWTWKHFDEKASDLQFGELQAHRARQAAAAKRARREEEVREAIAVLAMAGEDVTMRAVARIVGCSYRTLGQHYGHLFST